jgi:hypothetical protein
MIILRCVVVYMFMCIVRVWLTWGNSEGRLVNRSDSELGLVSWDESSR